MGEHQWLHAVIEIPETSEGTTNMDKTEKTWEQHVELAHHYLAIDAPSVYLFAEGDKPLAFVTNVKVAENYDSVNIDFEAVHPSGLVFKWFEKFGNGGHGVKPFSDLTLVMHALSPATREQVKQGLSKAVDGEWNRRRREYLQSVEAIGELQYAARRIISTEFGSELDPKLMKFVNDVRAAFNAGALGDLPKGKIGSAPSCPIATAFKDLGDEVSVGVINATIRVSAATHDPYTIRQSLLLKGYDATFDTYSSSISIRLPEQAKEFISAFDGGHKYQNYRA